MHYAMATVIYLATTLHPILGFAETRPVGSIAVSECVEEYGPRLEPGVDVTIDQAVFQIAVNYTCLTVYLSEHQISRSVASCVLDNLFLGMRTADYAEIDISCRTGRESERISSYNFMGVCMMQAMEGGLIVDRESTLAKQSDCAQIAADAAANPDYQWDPKNQ